MLSSATQERGSVVYSHTATNSNSKENPDSQLLRIDALCSMPQTTNDKRQNTKRVRLVSFVLYELYGLYNIQPPPYIRLALRTQRPVKKPHQFSRGSMLRERAILPEATATASNVKEQTRRLDSTIY